MAFSKFALFTGRSRRSEYWYFVLFNMIIVVLLGEIEVLTDFSGIFEKLLYGYYIVTLIPLLALAVRRMHDVGKSGWYIFIPIYNLILTLTEGDRGPNEYGEDPKAN